MSTRWDKKKYLRCVYLTQRTDHPGGDMVLVADADKTHLVGGTIQVLPPPKDLRFGKYVLTPREVRKLLAQKGWQRVVAFQTRNPAAPCSRIRPGVRFGDAIAGGP